MSDLFSKDCWYAIAGSTALAAGDVSPAQLFGEERVLWRGADDESHVWHNQCIHRGMRLQFGFVDQNRLSCRYHGWRFGSDGKCAFVPAHPNMTPPENFCVPTYPSAESDGLIWTTNGKPAGSPPDLSSYQNLTFCLSIVILVSPTIVATAIAELASSHSIADGLTEFGASSGDIFVVALQPVDDVKCQLHILTDPPPTHKSDARKRCATWARQFRWQVENGADANPCPQTVPA